MYRVLWQGYGQIFHNGSIKEGIVPTQWKLANARPIPKTRRPTVEDLRPISLLPSVSKVLEACVLDMVKGKLIAGYGPNQFGFRPGVSTMHAQLLIHDTLSRQLDDSRNIAIVLISFDMQKAFDSLNHHHLIQTFQDLNLPIWFTRWCINYLQERKQRVVLDGSVLSFTGDVTSGVPQGAVLAPYLFAAHMGSLKSHNPHGTMIKYADDVLVMLPITKSTNDKLEIQGEVNGMTQWCDTHGLRLNQNKTNFMFVQKPGLTRDFSEFSTCTEMKILGMMFNQQLTWDSHVSYIIKQASKRIHVLRQIAKFPGISKNDLVQIYFAQILGVVEFNSPVYVGLNKQCTEKLEKLRRRCHRIVCFKGCECSNFTPLFIRRNFRAMKEFRKLFQPEHPLYLLCPSLLTRTRHVKIEKHNTFRRMTSFTPFCSDLYNRGLFI